MNLNTSLQIPDNNELKYEQLSTESEIINEESKEEKLENVISIDESTLTQNLSDSGVNIESLNIDKQEMEMEDQKNEVKY